MWLQDGGHGLLDLARQGLGLEARTVGRGELVSANTLGSPHWAMSALRAWASGDSMKLVTTWAASRARALKGIARKWVLPMVPPLNWKL